MEYMLDTNIVSYYLKGLYPALTQRIDQMDEGDSALSVVIAGELWHGIERLAPSQMQNRLKDKLNHFLRIFPVLNLSADVAKEYAVIYAQLEKQGQVIGANDLWIAAHAKSLGLVLVTNNIREFERVAGLRVENWTE
jgi:tRNA(fMet)-specific endonuclease VapC